jgi:hypothetical protein
VAVVPNDPAGATAMRLVDVALKASPSSTRFWLDGRALEGNPFTGRLPHDGASHKLEARAPGFVTEERTVTLDGAVQVELALKAEVKAAPVAKPGHDRPADDGPSLRPAVPRTAKPIDTSDPYGGGAR